ncbi:MAG TPA: hypothetical protein VMU53_02505 [Candidatus Sulfotelmatobacter sp.]|nr:hypothetical protein [Candidatus Sulfotelmatobacter sp.]
MPISLATPTLRSNEPSASRFSLKSASFSWKNLIIRCASPACSLRLKVQPALLTRFRGIWFQDLWYHEPACLTEVLADAVKQLLPSVVPPRLRAHRLPLGLLLIERGAITPEQLREALRLQRTVGGGKLGYWLRQITSLDDEQLCAALGQQWGCPVFPLDARTFTPFDDALPYPLLAAAKAIPVHSTHHGRQRHIAFSERIDHTLLYALEEILECRTFPCVARESVIVELLEQIRRRFPRQEIYFDSVRDPAEMAATICSYAAQMDTRQIKVVPAGGHLWVGLFRNNVRRDLLFRGPAPSPTLLPLLTEQIKAGSEIADIRKDGVVGAVGPV